MPETLKVRTALLVFEGLENFSLSDANSSKRRLVFEADDIYINLEIEEASDGNYFVVKGTIPRGRDRSGA